VQVMTLQSPQRHSVTVERPEPGGDRLIILAGWLQRPAELFRAVLPHLQPAEVLPVARALGVPVPPPEAPGAA
jgi:hypothetical protein